MASASAAIDRTPRPIGRRIGGKHVIFTVFTLMLLYVLGHNEKFLVNGADPVWQHYQPFKWWLLPHGLAAACALLLGPLQFSDRLRQRYTKLHRVLGRFYVFGALIGGPAGVYIQYFEERMGGPRSFTMAAAVDAVLLAGTTLIAFSFILRGKVQQHRQWMTRSFAVAIVFLEVRVIGGLTGWDKDPRIVETLVWICVGMSVLIGDIVVYWQDLISSRPKAKAAVAGIQQ